MGYLPYQLVQDFFHQQQDRNVTQNWWLMHLQNMSTHLHGSYNRVLRAAPAHLGARTAAIQHCTKPLPAPRHHRELTIWQGTQETTTPNTQIQGLLELHSTLCKKCFGCWVCTTNASASCSTFAAIGLILQTVVAGHFKLDGILIFPVQGCTRRPEKCMEKPRNATCLAVGTSLARPACWLMLWKPPKWKKWVSKYILQPATQQFHPQDTQQL